MNLQAKSFRYLLGSFGLIVSLAAFLPSADAAKHGSSDTFDLGDLEQRLEELKKKEHSLRRTLERGQTETERLRQRVILRGRAYYRATRGLPGGDLMEYAVRVERLRQGVMADMARLNELSRQRKNADRSLSLLKERLMPLEVERRAAGQARDALLSQQERERAFEMAFSSSSAPVNHTAVYSAGAGLDVEGTSFESMRGRLPFPLPGRTEIEQVRLPHAAGPGLILRGTLGTVARAVYPGRVAFADTYSEYGNTVILDHGEGYFTLTSGLESIDVRVGDELPQNARLGLAQSAGPVSKIYFEVRSHNQTLPPGQWLGI